jgi:hypothetical protein
MRQWLKSSNTFATTPRDATAGLLFSFSAGLQPDIHANAGKKGRELFHLSKLVALLVIPTTTKRIEVLFP